LAEFTGERVIPGLVDADLFNEHVSRYKFAARLIPKGGAILDLGCGTGYGTVELFGGTSIVGADVSAEAVAYARANYGREGVTFLEASCEALPLTDHQFDLITCFEVIEHLENWRGLLAEAQRLLRPGGSFVVSTPNKAYYAETRGKTGPNPFHTHEFEYAEFESALKEYFPHVRIWSQNHAAAIVFAPPTPAAAVLEASGSRVPEDSHFFIAVCGAVQGPREEVFAWVPESGNLLRERESHIAKLEAELARKDQWLNQALDAHAALQREHEGTVLELRAKNDWAADLNTRIAERNALIVSLQKEAEEQLAWVHELKTRIADLEQDLVSSQTGAAELEADVVARTNWARHLETQLNEKIAHVRLMMAEQAEITGALERSRDAIVQLQAAVAGLREERRTAANSRWLRLGRTLHLGPDLRTPQE
jgi:ubiquinone/menaquinone biosynthesis C-methylase UbiE